MEFRNRGIMNSTKKRRRRRTGCLDVYSLLPFLLFSTVCGKDAAQQDAGTPYSSSSNSYNNKSSSKNNSDKEKKGFQNASPFCNQHFIEVNNGVYITCDTPGSYYYGGSAYRNSEVCKTGDKAKLSFNFYIPSNVENQTLSLKLESGFYDSFRTVRFFSDLCLSENITITSTDGTGNACPSPGYYQLYTTYQMPSIHDSSLHYTPDIRLTFMNAEGERIGCATTGTVAERQYQDRRATTGLIALGLGLFVFLMVFGLLLHLSHKRKKRLETVFENRRQSYHYFRTLPNGLVVPIPGAKAIAAKRPIATLSDDTINISNPAYNETHLPIRPMI